MHARYRRRMWAGPKDGGRLFSSSAPTPASALATAQSRDWRALEALTGPVEAAFDGLQPYTMGTWNSTLERRGSIRQRVFWIRD
jgi:hypothetical protein